MGIGVDLQVALPDEPLQGVLDRGTAQPALALDPSHPGPCEPAVLAGRIGQVHQDGLGGGRDPFELGSEILMVPGHQTSRALGAMACRAAWWPPLWERLGCPRRRLEESQSVGRCLVVPAPKGHPSLGMTRRANSTPIVATRSRTARPQAFFSGTRGTGRRRPAGHGGWLGRGRCGRRDRARGGSAGRGRAGGWGLRTSCPRRLCSGRGGPR